MSAAARTAAVTGPTSGIGLEFARQLAGSYDRLVLVARSADRLDELAEELRTTHGTAVEVLVADLAARADVDRVADRLRDPDRPVDLLVNNAGFGLKQPLLANDIEDEQQMLDVLVTAVLRLTHAALGAMVQRGTGAVVNVSSVAGYLPRGTYGAAKAWVTSFSEWADLTYRDSGVRVMALCPGFTRTEFHGRMGVDRSSAPEFLWLEAPDLVRAALRDLDRGRRVSVPGAAYKAIVAGQRYVPRGLLAGFQRLGRR